ncbi:MAG TPA: ABC transporter substrate-binding protein [Streptosporangiaceae bacterium]|nr:ABC transporter substrate-binding protein [Streptosporangiaceae bacterium]
MTAAACGSSSTTNNGGGKVSLSSGLQALNPGTGAPQKGGTLNMIGVGDVDYMDYNASYYTIGYLAQRLWDRGLYGYPAIPGKVTTVAPDLATGQPVVSNGGKTMAITIRTGAMWNTTPQRQVTAADVILGMKRACNPTPTHQGGLADYEAVVVGYTDFCTGFAKVSPTSLTAINAYMNTHQISGVSASGETLTVNLTQPSAYLPGAMTMDSWSPAPIESEKYLPGSTDSAQHMISDGPYQITSYVPTKSITLARNPAWQASSDPIRKAYVDKINITETSTEQTAQSVLATGGAAGGMEFNAFPPKASLPGLKNQMLAGSKNVNFGPQYGSNPYLNVNTISPNNNGALGKVAVRRAIFDAINRAHLTQDLGGPQINPVLTHILPNGINGAQDVPANFNPFTYDTAKAKSELAAAGYPNGLNLTVVYNAESTTEPAMFQSLQADMAPAGIHLKALAVPSADLYVKYAYGPSTAKNGTWDIGMFGWGPDWYGDGALTFFNPLYSCAAVVPAGSNYTYYCNKANDALIQQALAAPSTAAAASIWAKLDENVTNAAITYQITQGLQPNYHSSFVHNAVYVPQLQNFDPTNVWLSSH